MWAIEVKGCIENEIPMKVSYFTFVGFHSWRSVVCHLCKLLCVLCLCSGLGLGTIMFHLQAIMLGI